jgi:peptide/nickel transport system permease protein
MFLFLILRALLPLNTSPSISIALTFTLMGLVGWAASARVLRAGASALRNSDFILQARACGCRGPRLLFLHVVPNLRPIFLAQFWTSIPLFILGEANLGLLGLGVAEPLPSWGNLLRELETAHGLAAGPCAFVPLALLVVMVSCFQLALPSEHSS